MREPVGIDGELAPFGIQQFVLGDPASDVDAQITGVDGLAGALHHRLDDQANGFAFELLGREIIRICDR